jgi:hypothetical protein
VFEEQQIEVGQVADARKEKIDNDQAWEMIREFKTVLIGKGKKVLEFAPDEGNREEILKAAMGRSGNLRAPSIKLNGKLLIGYNDEMYTNL